MLLERRLGVSVGDGTRHGVVLAKVVSEVQKSAMFAFDCIIPVCFSIVCFCRVASEVCE